MSDCADVRCATYRVYLQDRATGTPVPGCDLTDLLDDTSVVKFGWAYGATTSAELTIPNPSNDCCPCLPKSWEHELVFERFNADGVSEGPAWVGPVDHVIDDAVFGELAIQAKDRSVWPLERRQVVRSRIEGDMDQADAFMALWADAEAGGPSGLTPSPSPVGRSVSMDLRAGDSSQAGWQSLSGVRWSVVGDRFYGPGLWTVPPLPRGNLDVRVHWEQRGAVIDSDGSFTASWVQVTGAGGVRGVWPPGPAVADPATGLHIGAVNDESVTTAEEAVAEARRIWLADRDGDIFLVTSGGTLDTTLKVGLCELVPGSVWHVDADVSCLGLSQQMRLVNVVVELEQQGPGVLSEARVAIDLQPVESDRVSDSRVSI